MEGQSSGSQNEQQNLETELTNMLQVVVPPQRISRRAERCIFRVPQTLRKSNSQAYTPRVVSIGPFHKANCALEPMEEVKLKYLKAFLNRTTLCVGDFVVKLQELENKIRSSYAEPIDYSSNDFLKMVLIDTSFIIEYSLRYYEGGADWWENDPWLFNQLLEPTIIYDLILLENQLPYFVLEDIYNLTGMDLKFRSFHEIMFHFFDAFNRQSKNFGRLREYPKHFLDLLRFFLLPSSFDLEALEADMDFEHLYSASQLSDSGLKFTACTEGFTYLDYHEGELIIPSFMVHNYTEILFKNIMAYEYCHEQTQSTFSQWLRILDFLINTEKDVNILIDKKIIINRMGDKNLVLNLFNNLGFAGVPYFNSKYLSICKSLNSFYENPCNQYKITLRREYFNTPWKISSTVAAIVLLLLTLIQTICSIIQLF